VSQDWFVPGSRLYGVDGNILVEGVLRKYYDIAGLRNNRSTLFKRLFSILKSANDVRMISRA
jgi:hypothetical protein